MFYKWTNDRLGWELEGFGVLGDRGPRRGDVLQMDIRPFRLGTGGACGFRNREPRLGDVLQMDKRPFRLGTGGPGVLGVRTGDRGPRLGDVLQMDKRPFRLGTGGH